MHGCMSVKRFNTDFKHKGYEKGIQEEKKASKNMGVGFSKEGPWFCWGGRVPVNCSMS